jgi:hypothetical protein
MTARGPGHQFATERLCSNLAPPVAAAQLWQTPVIVGEQTFVTIGCSRAHLVASERKDLASGVLQPVVVDLHKSRLQRKYRP